MYGYTLPKQPAKAGLPLLLVLSAALFSGHCLGASVTIDSTTGVVEYRQGPDQPWQGLAPSPASDTGEARATPQALSLPVELRSNGNGGAVLVQGDTSFELKGGAQLTLAINEHAAESPVANVTQQSGTVLYRSGPGSELHVETPFLDSASTGAAYVLVATETGSFLTLQSGTAELTHAGSGERRTLTSPGEVASASAASTDIVALVQPSTDSGEKVPAAPQTTDPLDEATLGGQMMTASLETTFDGASEFGADPNPGSVGSPADPGEQVDGGDAGVVDDLPGGPVADDPMPDSGESGGGDAPFPGGDGIADDGFGGDDLGDDDLAGDDFDEDLEAPGAGPNPVEDDLAGGGSELDDDDRADEGPGSGADDWDDDWDGDWDDEDQPHIWDGKKGLGHLKHHLHKLKQKLEHKHGHQHRPGERD